MLKRFSKLVRENRWTAFMLFFVLVLYSVVLLGSLFFKENKEMAAKIEKSHLYSGAELKQKEETVKQRLSEHPEWTNALSMGFMAFVIAGVVLDVAFLRRKRQMRPWVEHPLPHATVSWGLKDVFQVLVFLFFAEGCLFLLQVAVHRITKWEMTSDLLLLADSFVRDLAATIFVLLLLRRRQGRPFFDLGLRSEKIFSSIKTGLLGYVAMLPVLVLTFGLLAAVAGLFSYEPEPQNVVQIYLKASSQPYLLWFTLFVAALGPVLEEIFFRGFAYPALRKRFGIPVAMLLTSAVFAAFHMNLIAFFPIFVLGIFLCYLYESTGSLVPSISAHVLHNTLMVFLTLGFRSLSS